MVEAESLAERKVPLGVFKVAHLQARAACRSLLCTRTDMLQIVNVRQKMCTDTPQPSLPFDLNEAHRST